MPGASVGVNVELPPAMHHPLGLLRGRLMTYDEGGVKVVLNQGTFSLVNSAWNWLFVL